MSNITLYTAVPQYRLSFIKKYGLLQNDELYNMIESQIINLGQGIEARVFDESGMGYIYASTTLKNAFDWAKYISFQSNDNCSILKYTIEDESIVEKDICSPNLIRSDVRFKGMIKPENIKVISGLMYKNSYVDFDTIEEINLMDINVDNPLLKTFHRVSIENTNFKTTIKEKISSVKEVEVYTIVTKSSLKAIQNKLTNRFIVLINTDINEYMQYNGYLFATYHLENAIGWRDVADVLLNGESSVILSLKVSTKDITDNNSNGINKAFSDIKISRPVSLKDIHIIRNGKKEPLIK